MSPERKRAILAHVALQLGSFRAWRLAILGGLGAVLCLVVVAILAGVYLDGGATLDDIGLPAAFVAVLGPICGGGCLYGIAQIRALRTHELLLGLDATPMNVGTVRREADAWGTSLLFELPSGRRYRIYVEPAMADEILAAAAR